MPSSRSPAQPSAAAAAPAAAGCVWWRISFPRHSRRHSGGKRHFLRRLYIKCIVLPRQARDKHREGTQKRVAFRIACVGWRMAESSGCVGATARWPGGLDLPGWCANVFPSNLPSVRSSRACPGKSLGYVIMWKFNMEAVCVCRCLRRLRLN